MTFVDREAELVKVMKRDAEHVRPWDRDIVRPSCGAPGRPRPKPKCASQVRELFAQGFTYDEIESKLSLTREQVARVLFRTRKL